ncbi:hypothetical protein CO051_06195 [Candidatus Roizmanbacteria bacterium CG_4_9_14_0_2_um_filter_39_13]|uniref:Nucleotidyl transferase AbiEii/AbiGii toxin family protein n=2 Tax=Candidatus Roizmaniibacteriota TaxID=1752723 RepID=A0A2M8EWT2_9BACT|nr:MAG: hypothetical protein COY15_02630 [Candidatus Roizmanbacteria bacterium CG_4_10_14_0_2_um_filter_39_12]PJC30334.1 MAG: hypothetical protein CO051_06195 [Candidatus Roizmanbacteria bacterium CG_4_9_14_0_2_um_filter_39_13]PJE61668.1 MAG: hypothetical protein COU87_03460 [Candidatus Roizmanbacteria bacterium CG10_big_fil_rev_8_21_14_0_10_39_12]
MHREILTKKQRELLPLIQSLSYEFGLVGGTAVALQIGHRESIDFDLFKQGKLEILSIRKRVTATFPITQVRVENPTEYTIKVNNVQMTFYNYPFPIEYTVKFNDTIKIPDLLTLAAMKAFALGKRAKWKDYVDLYFIFQFHSLREIVNKAQNIFKNEFSEKLFREQLSYYQDIDYSEKIVYKTGWEVNDQEIRNRLTQLSVS